MAITVNTGDKVNFVSASRTHAETVAHTATAGASIVVLIVFQPVADAAITATYDGVAMTQAVGRQGESAKNYILYLVNPPTGSSKNCVISETGIDVKFIGTIVSLSGTATTSPIGDTQQAANDGSGNVVNLTVTCSAGSVIIDGACSNNTTVWAAGGSQSQLAWQTESATDGDAAGSSYLAASTGSNTMSWTYVSGSKSSGNHIAAEILVAPTAVNSKFLSFM